MMRNSTLGKKVPRTRKTMSSAIVSGPRRSTIQFILGYSRALSVVDAPPIGKIAFLLN